MSLTVVLALKDRAEFTPRFLQSVKGYPLIIADGSREPHLELKGRGDYFYNGPDFTYAHWFFKMVMALKRVQTPYAIVAANDDILVPSGLDRCVRFLDGNADYVAASGRIEGFWAFPDKVAGPRFARSRQYAPFDLPEDYGAATANERVLQGFANSWSFFAVYRTDALKTIWKDCNEIGFTDLQLHEKFCAMRALSLGKIKCDGGFASVLRQYGTSQGAGNVGDFTSRLMRSNFSTERDDVLKRMRSLGVDEWRLKDALADWYDGYLKREYGWKRQVMRKAKQLLPRIARLYQLRFAR